MESLEPQFALKTCWCCDTSSLTCSGSNPQCDHCADKDIACDRRLIDPDCERCKLAVAKHGDRYLMCRDCTALRSGFEFIKSSPLPSKPETSKAVSQTVCHNCRTLGLDCTSVHQQSNCDRCLLLGLACDSKTSRKKCQRCVDTGSECSGDGDTCDRCAARSTHGHEYKPSSILQTSSEELEQMRSFEQAVRSTWQPIQYASRSCNPCSVDNRACDKALPSCSFCEIKGAMCTYGTFPGAISKTTRRKYATAPSIPWDGPCAACSSSTSGKASLPGCTICQPRRNVSGLRDKQIELSSRLVKAGSSTSAKQSSPYSGRSAKCTNCVIYDATCDKSLSGCSSCECRRLRCYYPSGYGPSRNSALDLVDELNAEPEADSSRASSACAMCTRFQTDCDRTLAGCEHCKRKYLRCSYRGGADELPKPIPEAKRSTEKASVNNEEEANDDSESDEAVQLAPQSCSDCTSREVVCSKDLGGCTHCKEMKLSCQYVDPIYLDRKFKCSLCQLPKDALNGDRTRNVTANASINDDSICTACRLIIARNPKAFPGKPTLSERRAAEMLQHGLDSRSISAQVEQTRLAYRAKNSTQKASTSIFKSKPLMGLPTDPALECLACKDEEVSCAYHTSTANRYFEPASISVLKLQKDDPTIAPLCRGCFDEDMECAGHPVPEVNEVDRKVAAQGARFCGGCRMAGGTCDMDKIQYGRCLEKGLDCKYITGDIRSIPKPSANTSPTRRHNTPLPSVVEAASVRPNMGTSPSQLPAPRGCGSCRMADDPTCDDLRPSCTPCQRKGLDCLYIKAPGPELPKPVPVKIDDPAGLKLKELEKYFETKLEDALAAVEDKKRVIGVEQWTAKQAAAYDEGSLKMNYKRADGGINPRLLDDDVLLEARAQIEKRSVVDDDGGEESKKQHSGMKMYYQRANGRTGPSSLFGPNVFSHAKAELAKKEVFDESEGESDELKGAMGMTSKRADGTGNPHIFTGLDLLPSRAETEQGAVKEEAETKMSEKRKEKGIDESDSGDWDVVGSDEEYEVVERGSVGNQSR